jgi:hypothetical protein
MERWKIWVRFRDRSGRITGYGVHVVDYAHKCYGVRRAKQLYSVPSDGGYTTEWIVAQENPWVRHAEIYPYVYAIIDKFEELLDHHNITIPDPWREGNDDESRIYGMTHVTLTYNVEEIIMKLLDQFSHPQIISTPYLNN